MTKYKMPIALVFSCLAVMILAVSTADAGTKWQTNLVPEGLTDPTITEKGKVLFKDTGQVKVSVQGLTDGAGALVTTDTSWSSKNRILNGDEYMVLVTGVFTSLGVGFQFTLPMEIKAGKGKGKFNASTLFNLIPGGTHRASELTSAKVVGPLGVLNVQDCCFNVICGSSSLGGGYVVDLGSGFDNPCDQGDLIGVGGVLLE